MLRLLTAFVCFIICGLASSAQSVGDSVQAVEAALGRPQLSRTTARGEVWLYSTGVRITFQNGRVASIEGLENGVPPAAGAPAREPITVVPEGNVVASSSPSASQAGSADAGDGPPQPGFPAWFGVSCVLLAIVSAVCNILILIAAFRTGILWGLGSLLVPLVSLIFVAMHWQETKKPFLVGAGSAVVMVALLIKVGMSVGPG